jgi:epoxyqueuosine reductase
MTATIERIRTAAEPHGLNLVGAVSAQGYDRAVAPAYRASAIDSRVRSIVAIGNGGGAMWAALKRHAQAHPGWMRRENPLDDFTREVVETELLPAARHSGAHATVVYPFMQGAPTLNFIELAKAAGLGGPSIVGVAVHPVFGPWIAFRAALLVDEAIDRPGDASGFDPCPTCKARSCIAACPADAIAYPAGWDIHRCLIHRVEIEPDCAPQCHARACCVLGPEHRYPDDELAYHQMRALRAMRPYYEEKLAPERTSLKASRPGIGKTGGTKK